MSTDRPQPGLRERKKARTRESIQAEALRLFRERGYETTSVEQVAEAAEVSPSTVYRYFPSKLELVLWDPLDPLILAAFRAQPAQLSPLAALRAALASALAGAPPEAMAELHQRTLLAMSVPDLRAAFMGQLSASVGDVAAAIAERLGRPPDDFGATVLAGAVAGAWMSMMPRLAADPGLDVASLLDRVMAQLEGELPA